MPEVTVVIPVFNSARYLAQCLQSAMAQSFEAIEIICINDGSCDDSATILEEARRSDPRMRLLDNGRNLGAGVSRNRGIAAARGRFIRFLDSDDLLPPDSTEVLYNRATETGADLVRGSLALFDGDDVSALSVVGVKNCIRTSFKAEPQLWAPWWHTSYLLSSAFLRSNGLGYQTLRRGEDPLFLASVLVHSRQISLLEDIVYLYRKYPKSTGSSALGFADVTDNLKHAAMVKSLYEAHHPESWQKGYGPFLLKDFRTFLRRCRFQADEAAAVQREMEKIWGPGAYVRGAHHGVTEGGR